MRHVLGFLSLTLALAACGGPATPSVAESAPAFAQSENSVRNFHTVNANLFRSGDVTSSDFGTLERLGVKRILNLETTDTRAEEAWARRAGVEFISMPINGHDGPTLSQLNRALDIITDASAENPILVHCFHGADRTGLVIGAYRIKYDGWSVEDAIQEMRDLGHARNLYWQDDILYQVR